MLPCLQAPGRKVRMNQLGFSARSLFLIYSHPSSATRRTLASEIKNAQYKGPTG